MFARKTTVFVNFGKLDEAFRFFKEKILPCAKEQNGFKKAYYLVDRNSGKVVIITFWSDEECAVESESTGFYYTALSKMNVYFETKPVREVFEVND